MSPTGYLLLAETVVVVHFLFILFAVFGGVLVMKWKQVLWLHLAAVLWGGYVEFIGRTCPLTPLEHWLRQRAGVDLYQGGFISHYLEPLIYPPGLTAHAQWYIGGILIGVNLLIYTGVFVRRARR